MMPRNFCFQIFLSFAIPLAHLSATVIVRPKSSFLVYLKPNCVPSTSPPFSHIPNYGVPLGLTVNNICQVFFNSEYFQASRFGSYSIHCAKNPCSRVSHVKLSFFPSQPKCLTSAWMNAFTFAIRIYGDPKNYLPTTVTLV